jgi:hypothetical protein
MDGRAVGLGTGYGMDGRAVGLGTGYGMDGRAVGVRVQVWPRVLSSPRGATLPLSHTPYWHIVWPDKHSITLTEV